MNGDRGSASVWLLGVGLAVTLFAGAAAAAGGAAVARHRAQNAADFGALAAAAYAYEGEPGACDRARVVVEGNGGRLVECRLDGFDALVVAEVDAPGGWTGTRARARAGPLRG